MTIQQPLSFPPFFPRAETGAYDSPALGFLNHLKETQVKANAFIHMLHKISRQLKLQ
eukprot:m.239005 g.239005  ORF g.239005 m.239005 type:complete len:57 (+) comp54363_c2_seq28:200-370(+)